jgi:purine-nucleoside phosphorylase
MSTVPEVLVARSLGLRCLAFSVVTNRAAGLARSRLSHDEVIEEGRRAAARLADLLRRLTPTVADALYSGSAK